MGIQFRALSIDRSNAKRARYFSKRSASFELLRRARDALNSVVQLLSASDSSGISGQL
jgi:hypothetical protein